MSLWNITLPVEVWIKERRSQGFAFSVHVPKILLGLRAHLPQGLKVDAADAFSPALEAQAQFYAGGVKGVLAEL